MAGSEVKISPGMRVLVRDAFDEWHPAVADSHLEGTHQGRKRVHDFPVIWIKMFGTAERLPWPAKDVRAVGLGVTDGR